VRQIIYAKAGAALQKDFSKLMPSTLYITPALAIPLVQGAYNRFLMAEQDDNRQGDTTYSYFEAVDPFLVAPHLQITLATQPPVEDWLKFKNLVSQWRRERGARSSITEVATCPAYQSIIGMGEVAVGFILAELELESGDPDQWFWALRAITGADPVSDEDRGNYRRMARSWLQWAQENGYAW
jgi:hypothetical protein